MHTAYNFPAVRLIPIKDIAETMNSRPTPYTPLLLSHPAQFASAAPQYAYAGQGLYVQSPISLTGSTLPEHCNSLKLVREQDIFMTPVQAPRAANYKNLMPFCSTPPQALDSSTGGMPPPLETFIGDYIIEIDQNEYRLSGGVLLKYEEAERIHNSLEGQLATGAKRQVWVEEEMQLLQWVVLNYAAEVKTPVGHFVS